MQTPENYLAKQNTGNRLRRCLYRVLPLLSLLVVLGVFWGLKLTGITIAGDAFCGKQEHAHGESCEAPCLLEEHIHQANCYSDTSADLETETDWKTIADGLPQNRDAAKRLVQLALSQLGYTESTLNFQVDAHGVRRGITRYGQWYGNPYGDWSAMFVGFCLHYSGVDSLPLNAGPEALRLSWEAEGVYQAAALYKPAAGDVIFLDQDANGRADAVAILTAVADDGLSAIAGDLQDTVAQTHYTASDPAVMGYGKLPDTQLKFQPVEGSVRVAQLEEDLEAKKDDILVVYATDETGTYALDGNGAFVEIQVADDGSIYAQTDSPDLLFWVAEETADGLQFYNHITRIYLPPITTYAETQEAAGLYAMARAVSYSVWLDGTLGGLAAYGGSDNIRYTAAEGASFQLPETWTSPAKYSYTLQGWYDVTNSVYYRPGDHVTVTGDMVFYADWVASTYDIGQFNAQTTNTVSSNAMVTTHVFDYGILFNVLSSQASVSVSTSGHTENWSLITSGNNPYNNEQTLGFIFRDWDAQRCITYPSQHGDWNYPTNGGVLPGIYSDALGELLFATDNAFDPKTGTGVIGKTYLGTGDHLFTLQTDPNDEHYGYYYYNSDRHAASYSQKDQRFYVYDYLSRTSDSANTDGTGKYSDFLPLNSPYANTNGHTVPTYTYDGISGEYAGTTHYAYDAKYSSSGSAAGNVNANFWFGMRSDIKFYLPNSPGDQDAGGNYGNQDLYGKDMHFQFSGDDDVWVFVDGELVLDLGGIHGIESGDINFASGIVTVNGAQTGTIYDIAPGDHVLTICYLERGSSQSNCAIYFNLAPRFSFSIQKEDVLTKEVLNGAQFSVYTDEACTHPAQLWISKESHDNGDPATNVFTVTDGVANMWGMGAGNSYYIKETKPPDAVDYTFARGIIRVVIDKKGQASYSVELMEDETGSISSGFTVHGFRIDEQTQQAFIVATNAPQWVEETTGVWACKIWEDDLDHSAESVTVYLTVTDPDGTVRRLQEAQLSQDNGWRHRWENLPKYAQDGVTPIRYGVEEAYVSGYFSKVEQTDTFTVTTTVWSPTTSLENGKTYILKTDQGFLSTLNNSADTGYQWVSEDTAKASPLALWTVTTSGNKVMFTNGANQTISFYYGNGSPTDFYASTQTGESNNTKRYFNYSVSGSSIRVYYDTSQTDYYLTGNRNSSNKFTYATSSGSALRITPITKTVTTTTEQVNGWGYKVTNTPLEEETSLTVQKTWDYGFASLDDSHEQAQVTVELLANGKETGRTVTLSLKNGWKDTFRGLPYADENGAVILYSVHERWESADWVPVYGAIVTTDGDPPTYSTTVTNLYRWGSGELLPSTGSSARLMYMLCGGLLMAASLVYGLGSRRKRERRMK